MRTLPQDYKIESSEISTILSSFNLLISQRNESALRDGSVTFSTDSRKSAKDCGFIAYHGVASDGHNFIAAAVKAGAAFVVGEKDLVGTDTAIPFFLVTSARAAWSVLTAAACGDPQKKLKMLGVTGTNGKTSTAWMTHQLLQQTAHKNVMIGTLGAYIGTEFYETKHTTPDPDFLYPLLRQAVQDGASSCIMEVSSHAIAQDKLTPIFYDSVAFTSFSRDHLDFHKDENDYWQAKCRLFNEMTVAGGIKIICAGLPRLPLQRTDNATIVYRLAGTPDHLSPDLPRCTIDVTQETFQGSDITLTQAAGKQSGHIPFFGAHALENFTAALLLANTITSQIMDASKWSGIRQVPGRLEKIEGKSGQVVFVDYAHTPDALEKTLLFLKKYKTTSLTVIFGCGGDRDAGKRPLMGAIACSLADRVYVTSDNPRTEDPKKIISDILAGISSKTPVFAEPDRKIAIKTAIEASEAGDIILVAGKGHETYQIIGDKTFPFDDREVAREFLNQ